MAEHADEAIERGMMETSNYLEHRYADVETQHEHGLLDESNGAVIEGGEEAEQFLLAQVRVMKIGR